MKVVIAAGKIVKSAHADYWFFVLFFVFVLLFAIHPLIKPPKKAIVKIMCFQNFSINEYSSLPWVFFNQPPPHQNRKPLANEDVNE